MTGTSLMTAIIEILVSGITGIAEGIGTGLSTLVEELFFTTTGTGDSAVTSLSTFGTVTIVFAGVALAMGLSRWVLNFIGSLGSRNR